jgi:signal transduction histidine kinase
MSAPEKVTRKGSEHLRPRARIIRAIGEDLISNEIIALVELIKNAYDADSRTVKITFEPPLEPQRGAIVVADDGHGMKLDVVRRAWLEPATISKRRSPISPAGRRVTGEKGLGRFAAARLAERMKLDSVTQTPRRRVVAVLDWKAFRDEKRYLDQIRCKWEERAVTRDVPPGTTLRLEGVRDAWDEVSFRRLRAELARLIARPREGAPFSIELVLPSAFAEYAGNVELPPVLARPHYTLTGSVSDGGQLVATGKLGDVPFQLDETIKLGGRTSVAGPFEFELKVWDRDRQNLGPLADSLGSSLTDLRRDLDEACGVSIYRDSFRVLPYGGSQNDWLTLDLRRVNNPTLRLSNNQIVGAVHVTADRNPGLRDQTNREGLVDSDAFEDLRRSVVEILAHLESKRYAERRPPSTEGDRAPLFQELDFEPVKQAFKERYPNDVEFQRFLDERASQFRSSIDRVQQVIVRYRRLATLGRLIDIVLHDGRTPVAAISNECHLAKRDLDRGTNLDDLRSKLEPRLETIANQTSVLSTLFRRISPFGGRKRGRPIQQPIEGLISDAFAIFRHEIAELGIRLVLPTSSTLVSADPAEMQQIFVNLLENALYWLEKVPREQRAITVEVTRLDDRGLQVLFADSGPGIPEESRGYIFDPYFSTKPDGVGLGLSIAGEVVAEYDGALELLPPALLPGANFRITLLRRVVEEEEEEVS